MALTTEAFMENLKKNTFLALMVALALAISLIEAMIPLPYIAPGAKLGLSNIVILVTLVLFGFKSAISVAVFKSILLMLVTGNVSSFMYSISGAVLSSIVMGIANKKGRPFFSLIGVSILGALSHTFGQLAVASVLIESGKIFAYYPILTLVSLFTGCFVGFASTLISERLLKVYNFE